MQPWGMQIEPGEARASGFNVAFHFLPNNNNFDAEPWTRERFGENPKETTCSRARACPLVPALVARPVFGGPVDRLESEDEVSAGLGYIARALWSRLPGRMNSLDGQSLPSQASSPLQFRRLTHHIPPCWFRTCSCLVTTCLFS